MSNPVLVLDGKTYRPVGDVDELKRSIVAAARVGGGFVSFTTKERIVEVFVTDSTSITFERAVPYEDAGGDAEYEPSSQGASLDALSGLDGLNSWEL